MTGTPTDCCSWLFFLISTNLTLSHIRLPPALTQLTSKQSTMIRAVLSTAL